jgi:actin-related protein 10
LALRTSVIVSIGAVNTLVGLGGEPEPRWIIPTQFHHPDSPYKIYTYLGINEMLKSDETRKFAVDCISTLLEQLFLRFLLANPESVKITILESMTCPFKFKQALAEVLFRRFKAPLLEFLPAQPFALVALNKKSGIVVDIGYSETTVLPVVSNCSLLHAMQSAPIGANSIHSRISDLLQGMSPVLPPNFVLEDGVDSDPEAKPLQQPLDSLILEDICKQLCFVSPAENMETFASPQYVPYVDRFSKLLRINREIRGHAADVLFTNEDKEIPTLVSLILSSLLALNADLRIKMAHKLVLIGGVSMMRGLSTRLMQALEQEVLLPNSKFASLRPLSGHFEFINSPKFYQLHLPWIGASIDSSIENAHTPNQISANDFFHQKKSIPDWSSLTSTS